MNKWPIFSEKEVVLGNLGSMIGVATLWYPRNRFSQEVLGDLMNNVAVVGNLYSIYGIGILIRNFLANPNLRYLIVSGTELGKSRGALENLSTDFSILPSIYLSEEQVKRFLDQVKIIFVETKNVKKVIEEEDFRNTNHEVKIFDSIEIPLPKPQINIFPTAPSTHVIRARTIEEGYEYLLKEIRMFGHTTGNDSEGHRRQELWTLNMDITTQDPLDFKSIPHPEYSEVQIKEYCEDFWGGIKRGETAYAYGHIIRNKFGDQVVAAIESFKKKQETFRIIISLWDPRVVEGSLNDEDPPCITEIQLRIINNKLYQSCKIRTNDMFNGWPLNAIALRYFQYRFLECLKVELNRSDLALGDLSICSGSAHFYERDWIKIDTVINEAPVRLFLPDPKGNFEIKVEDEKIVVNHYAPDGTQILQIFYGTSALELSKKIQPFISQVQNALYIGRELMKMEIKLKGGK